MVATAGTTNAGIVDDLAGVAEVAAGTQPVVPRRRRLRRRGPVRAQRAGPVRRHRAGRLVHRRSPQVAVRPLRLRRPPLPPAQPGQGRAHPGRRRTSTCSTPTTRRSGIRATTPTT